MDSLEGLALTALSERCRDETARFRRGEPSDDRFCFELFRRAVVERDGHCWEELTAIYRERVLSWCRRSGGEEGELENLGAETWAKFWQSYTAKRLAEAAGSTAAALTYLKLCARSVVLDGIRRRGRTLSYDAPGEIYAPAREVGEDPVVEPADGPAFWTLVDRHLHDDAERLLVHLTYELGLKPAEVHGRHPDLFPGVRDVYRITRNILDRLRRSTSFGAWLGDDPH